MQRLSRNDLHNTDTLGILEQQTSVPRKTFVKDSNSRESKL